MNKKIRRMLAAVAAFCLLAGQVSGEIILEVWTQDGMVAMPRETYLVGVVAAEMPALYEIEALKAQAVAARTLAEKGCLTHLQADVCTDSGCCQAYLSQSQREERWGSMSEFYEEKIARAVWETQGEILVWEGKPILALFHAVSGGETEDVEQVYAQALPYLRGVESPGEEENEDFQTRSVFTEEQLKNALPDAFENAEVTFEVLERSQSGRILQIRAGRLTLDGRTLRSALGLKSTRVEIEKQDGVWIFWQTGYGHGVGMSQAGAQAMAERGADYQEILTHYYTGAEIVGE